MTISQQLLNTNSNFSDKPLHIVKDDKKIDLDVEKIKKLIDQRKQEKKKLAKGGIAGVL